MKQGIIEMAKAAATTAQKEEVAKRIKDLQHASQKTINKVNRILKGGK